jgi:hypothetical protein
MLPILRIIPVGGVLLAIAITVLALSPPDGSRSPFAQIDAPARGPLVDRAAHPEWRHFLIQAALRRAGELERLRELPDTPARNAPPDADESLPRTDAESLRVDGSEALAMETSGHLGPGSKPFVAPLPATPILPVDSSGIADLERPAAPAPRPDATRIATLLGNVGLPIKRSDAVILKKANLTDDAIAARETRPKPNELAPPLDHADRTTGAGDAAASQDSTAIDGASVAPATGSELAAVAPLPDEPAPPIQIRNIETVHESVATDEPSDAPATGREATASQPDDSTNVAARSESVDTKDDEAAAVEESDGAAAYGIDIDEAALSGMPVVLPRERSSGLVEPHQKRRPVRQVRHTRPIRTAANDPVTFNFFETLLRMFSANARPQGAAAIPKR